MRKGAIGGNLVMLGVFLTATVFGLQSLFLGQAFGQEVTESISDLNRIAETNSNAGLHFYNYLPMGASYSTHQKSYELAKKGGGENIEWKWNTLSGKLGEPYLLFQKKSIFYFNETYGGTPSGLNCDFTDSDVGLQPYSNFEMQRVMFGRAFTQSGQPVRATCHFGQGSAQISGGRDSYRTFFNSTDNRYFVLLNESKVFFETVRFKWRNVTSYSGSYENCPDSKEDVETEAESRALDDAKQVKTFYENVNKSYPRAPGFVQSESKIVDQDQSFKYGSTDLYRGSANYDTEEYECNCDPDGTDCETGYDSTVTITPESTEVKHFLKDNKYRIPTEEGWKHLEFRVDTYYHDFTKD